MTNSFGWSLPSAAIATTEAHFRGPWSPRRRMACWIDSMGRRNPQAAVRRGSRHDAGPGEEVPLEIFVAAVEGLVEVLLRLDLLREHLGAGAAQGPGDLVTPEGARLGEVHLHDVGEVKKAAGRRGGDDVVERDGAAARVERPAGFEDVGGRRARPRGSRPRGDCWAGRSRSHPPGPAG